MSKTAVFMKRRGSKLSNMNFWDRDIRDIGRDIGGRIKNAGHALRTSGAWIPQSIADLDAQMDAQIAGHPAASGMRISPESAMSISAFFNGVQQISQTVASLFPILYERKADGSKERYTQIPLYNVLRRGVGGRMSAFNWAETTQSHVLLWGNGYSKIQRNENRDVAGLHLVHPANAKVRRRAGGYPEYEFYENGRWVKYPYWQVLHIPGLGFNGVQGFSILHLARETLGLGLAKDQFEALFYGRGTHIGGVLEHESKMSDEAHKQLKEDFKEAFSGLGKSHNAIILEGGTKWKPTAMPLSDAEFLGSRQFTVQEFARWLNMPPHKLKELTHATFSNITESNIEYAVDTIRPWTIRRGQNLDLCLLSEKQGEHLFFESLIEALLEGNPQVQAEMLQIQRQNGIINADEWRAIKNMNPQPGKQGKTYWQPMNMGDAEMIQSMDKAPSVDGKKDDKDNLE
ncbi:hypothetical protein ES703_71021 [subsurface metagenome]